ncbi:MAG: hypothetical protein COA51_06735 [Idiomarina sp.]|uniref:Uncharacterized protein n=1 Tax=Pseudidiomarina marina TaxID=502366 RepID=A0A432YK65_9GAMM|nr:MAG: hypothetical protein COA51_06735 [Idiomarina sp.]RUO61354.1 hypothetical protein CWI76_03545 [Pseudidiomarina marina]
MEDSQIAILSIIGAKSSMLKDFENNDNGLTAKALVVIRYWLFVSVVRSLTLYRGLSAFRCENF